SAPGTEENLAGISVLSGRDGFRPLRNTLCFGRPPLPRPAVPPDLFHVVVELDSVALRIERQRGVINSGRYFARNSPDRDTPSPQELHGGAQLRICRDLDSN